MISIGRHLTLTDASGNFLMRVNDPFFSFKDSMSVTDASGNTLYNFNGDTSFRFMFQIASMSTSWNLQTVDGRQIFNIDDFYIRMEEFNAMRVNINKPSAVDSNGSVTAGGLLGNMAGQIAENMANFEISSRLPRRLVYQIKDQEEGGKHMGWIVPSRGTAWFDFLPYSTRIQILKIPFVARAYSPSYEFKVGDLSSPVSLTLKKQPDLLFDRYILQKTGDISEADEKWAIHALAIAALFERTRLKNIENW
jgi:hypothetical protein